MKWQDFFGHLLILQLSLVMLIGMALLGMKSGESSYFKLYELFGAALASTITVLGLLEMKDLTEAKNETLSDDSK